MKYPAIVAVFFALLFTTGCSDSIDVAEVPPSVIEAAYTEVPGIEIEEAEREEENGRVIYELEGETDEEEYSLEISETGEVLEVEKD